MFCGPSTVDVDPRQSLGHKTYCFPRSRSISIKSHTSALIRVKRILYFENKHFTNVKSLKNGLNTEQLANTNKG